MRVSKVSLCPPESEAGGEDGGGVLRTDCHDEVVIGSPSWVVARSLGCGPWTVTRHDIVMADGHYRVARTAAQDER